MCVNWVLGALSYYWVPSLGPFMAKPSLFIDLPHTGVTDLQKALANGRASYLDDPHATQSVQSVAAFASLHVSIIFTAALICHFVIPNKWVRWGMWVFFVLTAISTIYFGWHYLLDDVAGLAIGLARGVDRRQDHGAPDAGATRPGLGRRRRHRGLPARLPASDR